MSGIFGIIRLPGAPVADAELAPMAETLKHRGPDGINYFARENAGLGHCMLQSTPESLHETLPLRNAGLTITADARIDNREQLISDIPVHATSDQVITDSQLILQAYIKWGERCVDHLLGDFVFAIWDERARTLFVARDHMGCKPFYYHCHDGLFVFASAAMAVARVPEVKATLNEGRVADYLVEELEGIDKTCSWYNEISRLPPARCGYFRNNTFKHSQYWAPEPADLSHLKTDEDYLEAFTEVYTEAVRRRLRCQTEPASMLSGGLDSSTIVALARDIIVAEGGSPLRTYSGISEEGADCPESRSACAVVAQGNLYAKCLRPSDTNAYVAELDRAWDRLEDPFDGSWTLLALMFANAALDGSRAVLTGLDGDLAMGISSTYLTGLLQDGQWKNAWKESRGFSRHYYRGQFSASRLFLTAIRSRLTTRSLRKIRSRLGIRARYRSMLAGRQISKEFSERVNLMSRLQQYENTLRTRVCGVTAGYGHLIQVPYLTAAIERYERLASYFGVEARHPLLDSTVLQFCKALPPQYRIREGWTKYLLRGVADSRLPGTVAWREGHEQLGEEFFVARARELYINGKLPVKSMKKSLSPYLDQSCPANWQREGAGDASKAWLMNATEHYALHLWLSRRQ